MDNNFRRTFLIQISIAAGIILAFAAVTGWFAADLTAQADRAAQDRKLIRERSASIAALAELKRNASQALRYEEKLNAFLPTQEQLLDFPRTLDNLARVRRLALNFGFQGGQTAPQASTPGTISFALDVTGALEDIRGFLKDVEFEPPRFLATFDTFDVTRNNDGYRLLTQGRVFFK